MATLQSRLTAVIQAIGADVKALTAAVAGGGSSGGNVFGQFPGPVVVQVGSLRYYPRATITFNKLTVWLSANAVANTTVVVKKNGVAAQTIIIAAGQQSNTAVSTISILTTDYLTIDITSGSGNDLMVRLDY